MQLQVENQRAQNNLKLKDKYTLQDPSMGGGSSNSICGCGGGSAWKSCNYLWTTSKQFN